MIDTLFWLGIIAYLMALVSGAASMAAGAKGEMFDCNANLLKLFIFGAIGMLIHYAWLVEADRQARQLGILIQ